jgi:hypothetical protein
MTLISIAQTRRFAVPLENADSRAKLVTRPPA